MSDVAGSCHFFQREGLLREEAGADLGEHLETCPQCRGEQRRIAAVRAELRALPLPSSSGHWQQAVFARVAASDLRGRPRRRWWLALPATGALALLLLLLGREGTPPPRTGAALLALRFEAGVERLRSGSQAAVGAQLVVQASGLSGAHRELRVYRDDAGLALHCSREDPCRPGEDGLSARWRLPATGRYRVLVLESESPLPWPAGSLDADRAALERGKVKVLEETFEVW